MLIRTAMHLGGIARAALVLVVATSVILLAAGLGLTWRLSQGPLDVDWLARRIEAAANLPDQPTRLSVSHAALRWGGGKDDPGQGRGLELMLQDLQLADRQGLPVATVAGLNLTISMGRLLLGQVVPHAMAVRGMNISLERDAHGDVSLDLGGLALSDSAAGDDLAGPTLRTTLAELARPPRRPGTRPPRPDLQHIEELERVSIGDSIVHLHDPALGSAIRFNILSLDLRRQARGGVHGAAAATLSLGDAQSIAQTTLAIHADLAPNGGTEVQVAFAPIDAVKVQAADPALGTADMLDIPVLDAAVQGAGTLRLDNQLRPVAAALRLGAGGGRIGLAGSSIGFDSLAFDAQAAWDQDRALHPWSAPQHLTVSRARAVVHAPGGTWPTTLTLAGHADLAGTTVSGDAEATLDHLDFADIGALWPERLGGHIRPWLVPNVTAGIARDGAIKLRFTAPRDLSDIALTAVDGSVKGDNITIWWLRPVPPIEQAQALMTIKDPQTMTIAVSSGRQGSIALSNGLVRFTGLSEKDQFMALGADVAGGVPELLALLRNPALQLLSRSPIPVKNPAGTMTGHLAINMPMKDVVEFEDVRIQTTAKVSGLRLGGLVAGRDLDRGTIQMEVNSDALHAAGNATVAGVPADLVVDMDFRNGGPAQVVQKASAVARMTGRQLAAAGLDPGALMPAGAGLFNARYAQRRDGSAEVQVNADLRDAALAAAGWSKGPGQPADMAAKLLLRGDQITGIDQLHAKALGLAVDGHVEMVGDQPLLLVLDRLVVGPTQASGQVRFPAASPEPIRVNLGGPVLDLSTIRDPAPKPPIAPSATPSRQVDQPQTPWIADVRFDRVLLSPGHGLNGVVAHAENDGRRLSALTLTTAAPEQVRATIRPEGVGRRLSLKAEDGGALLRAADMVGTIQGGRLSVNALYDDRLQSAPLAGTVEMSNFSVRNAPGLGKLLQAVTIYGVVDALRGPGLGFSTMVLPFQWEAGVLQLTDARASSASLGLTARGRIDTLRNTVDLQGTVVPAYILNTALGRLPLLGRLFSAERGGGLVAVDYTLHGAIADPAVTVNPLSALTPGFLRGLFHIFD